MMIFPTPETCPVTFAVNVEGGYTPPAYNPNTWDVELRPVAEWRFSYFDIDANPIIDFTFTGPSASSRQWTLSGGRHGGCAAGLARGSRLEATRSPSPPSSVTSSESEVPIGPGAAASVVLSDAGNSPGQWDSVFRWIG
jgi:hypothetical protein